MLLTLCRFDMGSALTGQLSRQARYTQCGEIEDMLTFTTGCNRPIPDISPLAR